MLGRDVERERLGTDRPGADRARGVDRGGEIRGGTGGRRVDREIARDGGGGCFQRGQNQMEFRVERARPVGARRLELHRAAGDRERAERDVGPVALGRQRDRAVRADQRHRLGDAAGQRHGAGDRGRLVRTRQRQVGAERRVAGECDAAGGGQRGEIGHAERDMARDPAGGAQMGGEVEQGVDEVERHGPVGLVEMRGRIERHRGGGEQVRLRPGNAQGREHRVQRHGTPASGIGASRQIRLDPPDRGAAGREPRDEQVAVGHWLAKRAVQVGVERHRLPAYPRHRLHRRRMRRDREARRLVREVHQAVGTRDQLAGRKVQMQRFGTARAVQRQLECQRADLVRTRECRHQPARLLVGGDAQRDPALPHLALEPVGAAT